MHPNRLRVFQYLCAMPCSHLRAVADGVGLGTPTVAWHLERLGRAGLVTEARVANRKVYYPARLVDPEAVKALHAATDPQVRDALVAVMGRPGATVGDVAAVLGTEGTARRTLKVLVGVGLLDRVRDGRYWRYFPAEAINDLSRQSRARVRQFRKALLQDLQRAGLRPETDVSPRGEAVLSVVAGGTRVDLVVPDDPLASILLQVREGP